MKTNRNRGKIIHPKKAIHPIALLNIPQLWKSAFLVLFVFLLALYIGSEVRRIFTPPSIAIISPVKEAVLSHKEVRIIGKTEREVALLINGKSISPDEFGRFSDTLILSDGAHTITIIGKKKYSKETVIIHHVIIQTPKEQSEPVTNNNDI